MFRHCAILLLAATLAAPLCARALAGPPAPSATAAPDAALTSRFAAFLTDVLAGKLPATGVTKEMAAAFTPEIIGQVQSNLSPLGAFKQLQFVSKANVQGYQRFHYTGVFAKGSLPLLFVVDSNGNIAGFFADQPQ
jgi:hypothetical protein